MANRYAELGDEVEERESHQGPACIIVTPSQGRMYARIVAAPEKRVLSQRREGPCMTL